MRILTKEDTGVVQHAMNSTEDFQIDVNGHAIAYREAGQGEPLVLLHGFLCDSRCWRTQLAGLSDTFRVIAWDAPGAGLSTDPPDPYTISDWSACLAKFLSLVGNEQAHILGLSWGGLLAQEYYRLYPGRVLSLVLAGTYAGWKGSLPEAVSQQRLRRCEQDSWLPPEEFVKQWVPEMFSANASQDLLDEMSGIISDFHPRGFRLMAKSLADTDTVDLLPTIQSPTLILWGEDDRRSPLSNAEMLWETIPNAELAIVANAGHVSNMEQPDVFNAQVRRFCLSKRVQSLARRL